jgi:hypothetical protein
MANHKSEAVVSYQVRWLDSEQTILLQAFQGRMHAAEIIVAATETDRLYLSAEKKVFVLIDLTGLSGMPGSILPAMDTLEKIRYIKECPCLIVTKSVYIIAILQIVKTLSPDMVRNVYRLETMEQALALIEELKANNGH